MRKIKWGIIGLGERAHHFASQFETAHAEIVAVASRTLQKAFDFSQIHDVKKAYGSYQELAYDPEIDSVYIATPNRSHYTDMLMLVNAGKHVLCETPLTLDQKELNEVLDLAKNKKVIVAEAMPLYHMPLYKIIKTQLAANKYGKLKTIHTVSGIMKDVDLTARLCTPNLEDKGLLDSGVYAFSFIRYFLNSQPVARTASLTLSGIDNDDESTFNFKNTQGETGTASIRNHTQMPLQGTLVCEMASIIITNYPRATHALVVYADGQTENVSIGTQEDALSYEIEDFSNTLLSGEDLTFLSLTRDVNELLDWAMKEWHKTRSYET